MNKSKILSLAQGGIIAALYTVVCVLLAPISYGNVQVRVAEALAIMPIFTPAAIPGLFIGCMLANIIAGGIALDVIFGSLATLIGAAGTYLLRNQPPWIATIPPIVSNTVIVPLILYYGYGLTLPIWFMMFTVCIGEVIGCGVLGVLLAKALNKVNFRLTK